MNYAVVQTILLIAFTGAYIFGSEPQLFPVEGTLRAVGGGLCAGGLLIMLSAFISLGRAIQIDPEPKQGAQLVQRGIYRYLRHPIYTGILLVVVGLFLRRGTVAVGIGTVVVIAFLAFKVRLEERLLKARYPEYKKYRAHSWGLIPWPRRTTSRS